MAQNQFENDKSGAKRVALNQLPKDVQEKIVRLQYFKGEHFSQKLTSPYFQYLLIIIGLVWFVTLFAWANDELWSQSYLIAYGAVTTIAAVVFVYGLYILIRAQTSRLQPFVHVTPTHFIKTDYTTIEYRDLGQLRGITHDDALTSGGRFSYSLFDFYFDDREEKVKVPDERRAKEWFARLHEWDSRHKQAVEQNDTAFFRQHDIFQNAAGTNFKASGGSANFARAMPFLFLLIGVPVVTAGVLWGANRYNQNVSDNKDWTETQKAKTAAEFRKYLAVHQTGSHRAKAAQNISEIYDNAARKYVERQKGAESSSAAQAFLALINHAKTTGEPIVKVVFERKNELTNEHVQKIKKQYDEPNLMSVGTDFSEEKMIERENSIVTAIELAFKQTIPADVLTFVKADARAADAPALFVSYNIKPTDGVYDKIGDYYGENLRFLGFTIDWNCELSTPEMAQPHRFALVSKPAAYLGSVTYGEDLTKFSMYEMMTGSAFNDFGSRLADEFGLGKQAVKTTETEKPIPNKSGKKR